MFLQHRMIDFLPAPVARGDLVQVLARDTAFLDS